MSTVLRANVLVDGTATSHERDKPALHRHAGKLDAIFLRTGGTAFLQLCDITDQAAQGGGASRFNFSVVT